MRVLSVVYAVASTSPDRGFNPFGLFAVGVGVVVLIILLITFRRH